MYRYWTCISNWQTNGEEACSASGDNFFLTFLHVTILVLFCLFVLCVFIFLYCSCSKMGIWYKYSFKSLPSVFALLFIHTLFKFSFLVSLLSPPDQAPITTLMFSVSTRFISYSSYLSLSPNPTSLSFHPSFLFSHFQFLLIVFLVTVVPGLHLTSSFTTLLAVILQG